MAGNCSSLARIRFQINPTLTDVFRSQREVKFVNDFKVASTKEKDQKNLTKN